MPWCFFRYEGTKTFAFPSKNWDFLPQSDQVWPEIGIFGHLGQALPAHLVPLGGWLVVVACGLYLARHIFTLCYIVPRVLEIFGKNVSF